MKKASALILSIFASSAFCVDEYMPIEKGKFEVDLGFGYTGITGSYDSSGKKSDDSGAITMVPIQLKYGIIPGLDAEVVWNMQMNNKDAGDLSGFTQPEIALKYAMPEIGAGLFVDGIMPFALGDWGDTAKYPAPALGIQIGAVFGKTFDKFRATAVGSYRINLENSDSLKMGNLLDFYFKPEFLLNEFAGIYAGIKYDMASKAEFGGTAIPNSEGFQLTILPGWNATWLKWLSTEINVPYVVMGKNAPASWGVTALFYATFPM